MQAAADAAAEEVRQKQSYERMIAEKQAGLPAEPSTSDEDVTRLLVRMPNGSRIERRWVLPALILGPQGVMLELAGGVPERECLRCHQSCVHLPGAQQSSGFECTYAKCLCLL